MGGDSQSAASKVIPVGLAVMVLAVAAFGALTIARGFAFAFGIPGIIGVVAMCAGAVAAATVVTVRRRLNAVERPSANKP